MIHLLLEVWALQYSAKHPNLAICLRWLMVCNTYFFNICELLHYDETKNTQVCAPAVPV